MTDKSVSKTNIPNLCLIFVLQHLKYKYHVYKTHHSFTLLLAIALFSCKNEKVIKANPTGNAGEILVIMNDSVKKSKAGLFTKEFIQQPMLGLPQEESLFKIYTAPNRSFEGQLMTFRNIITIKIDRKTKNDTVLFYKDLWAKDQSVARVYAKSKQSLLQCLKDNEIRILGYFLSAERTRNINYFKAYPNREGVDHLKSKWDLYLCIPNTFEKKNGGTNFSWLSEEASVHSIGIFVYSFDYVGEGSFSKEYLLNKRDSVLKENVPGSFPNSYMATENKFPVIYKTFTSKGNQVVELRGLWKVQGDLMGGPFVSHARLDKTSKKVIVTEGYVYSPEKPNKRNFMWQAEAILYSYDKVPSK